MTPPGSRSTTAAATGPSPNFAYLAHHDPRLAEVATRAERVLGLDPEGALNHLRLFGELVAKNAAARLGAYEAGEEHQVDRLRALRRHNLPENVLQMLHGLRQAGKRGDNLDISWLKDEGAGNADDLPEPEKIAAEIVEKLKAAMSEMEELQGLLEGEA